MNQWDIIDERDQRVHKIDRMGEGKKEENEKNRKEMKTLMKKHLNPETDTFCCFVAGTFSLVT